MNKKISCIYCSESPGFTFSSNFLSKNDPLSRLKHLTQSLTEVCQKFAYSSQKLRSILDQQPENLEPETFSVIQDAGHDDSFEHLQTSSILLHLKNADFLLQNVIKKLEISESHDHRDEIDLDTHSDFQCLHASSKLVVTVSHCLTLSIQLQNQLKAISERTSNTVCLTDSDKTQDNITPKNTFCFYTGGMLSHPRKSLILFLRSRASSRRQLEF